MPHIQLNDLKRAAENQARKRYHEYLNSPEWLHRRDAVLTRDYMCRYCGVNVANEVHHLHYRTIYRERLGDLVALCGDCHELVHEEQKQKFGAPK